MTYISFELEYLQNEHNLIIPSKIHRGYYVTLYCLLHGSYCMCHVLDVFYIYLFNKYARQ